MKVLIGVLCLMVTSSFATRLMSADDLQKVFVKYLKNEASEHEVDTIQDALAVYRPVINSVEPQQDTRSRESVTCLVCRSAFGALFDLVREGASDAALIGSVTQLCASLGFVTPRACRGVIELNIPILTYIIRTTPQAAPRTFCGLVLQRSDNRFYCPYDDPRFEWTVTLPPRRRAAVTTNKDSDARRTPLTVALVSEAHIDPLYVVNGVADCNEPTCCRKGQTPRTLTYDYGLEEHLIEGSSTIVNDEVVVNLDTLKGLKNLTKSVPVDARRSPPAGFWGDYRNCNTPVWAYDDAIERIASTHRNVDIVYYMGDSIDHHVWETTYERIDEVNAYVINKMRREFGNNVMVVPTIGNHESQPTNQFAPHTVRGAKLNTTWLYEGLARKWDFYLTAEAKATLRTMGAFAMPLRPGLRVISMNSNIAFKSNWWLVFDPLDSKRHLDWLVQELHKAELAGEKVHILGHVPPGVHCFTYTWTREYNRIITRFSSIIAGEFTGHTHSDEFKIFYSLETGAPINVVWGAGSVTAYTNYNLNYKIATLNPTTFEATDMVSYMYNLTEANLTPNRRPRWFQLYNFRNDFGIRDLSATSMDTLVHQMVTTRRNLLSLYSAFLLKLSDRRWPYCNEACQVNNLCRSVITVLWRRERCENLWRLFLR